MCTVTVYYEGTKTLITMNRDEQKNRPKEKKPFYWEKERIYAPQDTLYNGTWIGVNSNSQWACLLNGYSHFDDDIKIPESRGRIIPYILNSQNPFIKIRDIDFSNTKSFCLFVGNDYNHVQYFWNTHELNIKKFEKKRWFFETSSSYETDKVIPVREKEFENWRTKREKFINEIPSIHLSESHEDKAVNTFMCRPDAKTKSITQISISAQTSINYWDTEDLSKKYTIDF